MEIILLIFVAIACFFILKWSNNVESKHKEKERKRLKISEDDYLKAHKSLKSSWLSREQQEEQIVRNDARIEAASRRAGDGFLAKSVWRGRSWKLLVGQRLSLG